MSKNIDLLNEIAGKEGENLGPRKHGRFRASIITAYTAYLPFYENVVLRRLLASGCRYNILLVDARDLALSLEDPNRMPRLAGRNYILVPMRSLGAFHPKIVLLVGEHNARILVGSHNTTLSGFGYNRELTTRIDLGKGFKGDYRPFFQAAWSFIDAWISHQQEYLSSKLMSAVRKFSANFAPWLQEQEEQHADLLFLGSTPNGESLWEQTRSYLPEQASQVIVLGPFFDKKGSFLKTMSHELSSPDISVGLDAEDENICLCSLEGLPQGVHFHNASTLSDRKGYLHAKALYFMDSAGEALLLTGSANPSYPAWNAGSSNRNAEAVVLHRGKEATNRADELDLVKIPTMPEIGYTELQQMLQKSIDRKSSQPGSRKLLILVAEPTSEGDFIIGQSIKHEEILTCRILLRGGSYLDKIPFETRETEVVIKPKEQLDSITQIVLTLTDDRIIRAFVHNPSDISRLATTSKQQRFRDALDSLSGDSPDFSELLRIADKLIFDESREKDGKVIETSGRDESPEKEESETSIGPTTVSKSETKFMQRRKRESYSGDLAYIIEMLIYHLGLGLREAAEKMESQGPNEEEQVGTEDDEQGEMKPEDIPFNLVKICHSKITTLVSRMCRQFDNVSKDSPGAGKVIEQILAVLAVLREVRANDLMLAHLTEGDSLVPMKQRRKLLAATLKALFGSEKDIFDKTAEVFKDDPENDMPRLLGLIIWLAWDCELHFPKTYNLPVYESEARQEALIELAKLLEISIRAGRFIMAIEEARLSIWRTMPEYSRVRAGSWLRQLENWARDLTALETNPGSLNESGTPQPGQIGICIKEEKPKFRLILNAYDRKVQFAELGKKNETVMFSQAFVKAYQMPAFDMPQINP